MPSVYHVNIEKEVMTFGRNHKKFCKIYGSKVPIPINHPSVRLPPIHYYPDVQFITKIGKRYIFEILDSELKDENRIISNILLSCLAPNTSEVIFIVPTEEDQDKVKVLVRIVRSNLMNKGVSEGELPKIVTAYILRSEVTTPENVMHILSKIPMLLE